MRVTTRNRPTRAIRAVATGAMLACGAVLAACAGPGGAAARPARISHVVFFKLEDPALQAELLADCDRLLPSIPGVVSYAAGRHLDVGRDTVDGDYDIGLYIGFETESDYAAYIDHPNHTELVGDWRERLAWLRVHDIVDDTE